MTFRPMPILTVLSLISLVILVMLGNWQYSRYSEKMAQTAPSVKAAASELIRATVDIDNPGMAQHLYGAIDGEPVWRRFVPGRLVETEELVLILWDATGGPRPIPLAVSDAGARFERVGNVLDRAAKRGTFAVKDDPENNTWHSLDTALMAKKLGYDATPLRMVETLAITVRNSEDMSQARRTANPYAFEQHIDPLPPQRHFGYALTWWGMAIGLMGVYLVLHHSQGRLRFRS